MLSYLLALVGFSLTATASLQDFLQHQQERSGGLPMAMPLVVVNLIRGFASVALGIAAFFVFGFWATVSLLVLSAVISGFLKNLFPTPVGILIVGPLGVVAALIGLIAN